MPDSKITALDNLTSADPANDMIPIVDVSATPPASGNTKRISINNLLACSPSATLASATITGDLTVASSILKVSGGNVGINTASPTNTAGYKTLEIVGTGVNTGGMIRMKSSDASVSSYDFVDNNGRGIFALSNHNLRFGCNDIEQYRIQPLGIFTWYDGAGGTRMTLNSTGLGVGGSPTNRFEVFSGFIKNTATTGSAQIIAGNTGGVFTLAKDSSTGGNFTGTAYASVLYSDGAYPVCIFSNGSERLRIDSSGNVGVGVTPSTAWNTAGNLQIGIFAGLYTNSSLGAVDLTSNSIRTGSDTYQYLSASSNAASRFQQRDGSFRWFNAIAGTSPNAITFTQAMTLTASGDLGVGITNPSFRLHALVSSGADRDIFAAQVLAASNGLQVKWNHATTTLRIILANIPTSSAGLATGTLWNDAGTIKIA